MEELEKIAEVISSLGDDGVRAFIWYLIMKFLSQILISATWPAVAWMFGRTAVKMIGARAVFLAIKESNRIQRTSDSG